MCSLNQPERNLDQEELLQLSYCRPNTNQCSIVEHLLHEEIKHKLKTTSYYLAMTSLPAPLPALLGSASCHSPDDLRCLEASREGNGLHHPCQTAPAKTEFIRIL